MANALLSLVLEASDHAQHIEIIIEQKAASEAKALANAVTPDLQSGIEALTAKLKSIRQLHETVASAGAAVASTATTTAAATSAGSAATPAATATTSTPSAAATGPVL